MKTKIFSLVLVIIIMFNTSFANYTVNETVLNTFSQQFVNASEVNWSKTAGYYKASFTWNGQFITAFYEENGTPVSVSRNILKIDLPLFLQTNLLENYADFWIIDLFEYTTPDNTKFYLTVENGDKRIILESNDNNYWTVFKKSSK